MQDLGALGPETHPPGDQTSCLPYYAHAHSRPPDSSTTRLALNQRDLAERSNSRLEWWSLSTLELVKENPSVPGIASLETMLKSVSPDVRSKSELAARQGDNQRLPLVGIYDCMGLIWSSLIVLARR